ncbi:Ctr copper transporter [Aulographum hederae CBS 113979]|uniref:Copper transport protein n=1 Tax=Aulographum hederae CBS 113979 TaxID=1176131 RepID=A0A6G1GKT1_9PEZI|nr:Ctr copper transporter [Aulographum hederae CBS 113979]
MDHSKMDHSSMDHSGMDHGGMQHRCNMNMLFTWSTQDLCIVFRSWHIHSTFTLVLSLLGVVALCAGYELVRELSRRYEAACAKRMEGLHHGNGDVFDGDPSTHAENEASSLLYPGSAATEVEQRSRIIKGLFYAVQVFYSFFIMLLFMTYNGWIMLAVAVGSFVGYVLFGGGSATKTVACH